MKHTIYKGFHRALPPMLPWLTWKKEFNWKVRFNRSAVYSLGADQTDINKLCGVGYFPSHHKDSARFGWRYNWKTDKIELLAYCYVNGVSNHLPNTEQEICSIGFDEWHTLKLSTNGHAYYFLVDDVYKTIVMRTKEKRFGYRLGLYFGGNKPSPAKMSFDIKRY